MRMSLLYATTCALLSAAPAFADQISVAGRDRSYSVYRPADLARTKPVPLVIVLHGGFGTGEQAEKTYHWDATADRSGFVVIYPHGFRRSWNAGGGCCGPATTNTTDDLGFLTDLIPSAGRAQNTDPTRVY